MLLNTYTAKGRAVARALSTYQLRHEMRVATGTWGRVTLTTSRPGSGRADYYPLRVCKWLEKFLLTLPTAPDEAALLEQRETLHICIETMEGKRLKAAFWSVNAWPVFRALLHHNISQRKENLRQVARLRRRLRDNEVAQLIYLAANGGEGAAE